MFSRIGMVGGVAAFCAGLIGTARADLYGFTGVTNNNAVNTAAGIAQLSVEATDSSDMTDARVLFTFRNAGPAASSITDIYFDADVSLASIHSIVENPPDVDFGVGASPPDLPGGSGIMFASVYSLDSEAPPSQKGVNPNESVGVIFNIADGFTFADVLGEIESGALRIGIHVQSFENGGSEAFVNTTNIVPVPGAAVLCAIGLGIVGVIRRKAA